jgi:Leucine-rich repeat (LRR) protein
MKRMMRMTTILMLLIGCALPAIAAEPNMKCSFGGCTAESGLTDAMITQFTTKDGNYVNTSLTLNGVTNDDLKKLPALKDTLEALIFWEKVDQVTDLAPLAELQKVKKLQLRQMKTLADLAPLANMKSLATLDLYALESVTDLTPVGKIAGLQVLTLAVLGKPIDMTPLGKLTNLKELRISQSVAYTSFDFLKPLKKLERVYFLAEPKNVIDISALAGKTTLQELTFSQAQIADITPLKGLTGLVKLALNGAKVTDLSALKGLKKLKSLELGYLATPNLDLNPVGELTELTYLNITNSTFKDYAPLAKCTKLESLEAKGTSGFDNLQVLSALPNLKRLNLWENKAIQKWDALAGLTNLEALHVGRTSFSNASLLTKMTKLAELGMQNCTLTNFETLATLPGLTNLLVSGAQGIADISVLKTAAKIDRLYIGMDQKQFPQEQLDALKKAKEEAEKAKQKK